tara:strand:- start:104037 stop:104540 length:504 start_codon:yes stop_codon:yes gene_type:complete
MKILATERLILEKVVLEDAVFFIKLLNSPNWIKFIGDRRIKTIKESIAYIENSLMSSYQQNGYGLYKMCLRDSREPIGICGFIKRDYLENADIGFAILPEFEGKGYTYEAASATLVYGKTELKLEKILALTTEENKKSRYLLSKIGLTKIGSVKPNKGTVEFLLFSN